MNVESARGARKMRILLYALIPADRAFLPIRRTRLAVLRGYVRRTLELIKWNLTSKWTAHYSAFEDSINCNRGDIAIRLAVRRRLDRLFISSGAAIVEVAWGELDRAIDEGPWDLIVIAGGGYLFADPAGRLPPRFANDLAALERAACPVAAISIGLNHLMGSNHTEPFAFHPDEHDPLRRFLARMALISVRDETTRQALAAVATDKIEVIVDPAYLLASRSNVFDTLRRKRSEAVLSVGINLACHGTAMTDVNHNFLDVALRALMKLRAHRPCRFYFFIHSDGERGLAIALRQRGLPLEIVDGDVDAMLEAYGRLDIHLAQMLHSSILAMGKGVPTLGLAYDLKFAGFFDLLGLSRLCHDPRALTAIKLFAALTDLAENRREISDQILLMGHQRVADADRFYQKIPDLVGNAHDHNADLSQNCSRTRFG